MLVEIRLPLCDVSCILLLVWCCARCCLVFVVVCRCAFRFVVRPDCASLFVVGCLLLLAVARVYLLTIGVVWWCLLVVVCLLLFF